MCGLETITLETFSKRANRREFLLEWIVFLPVGQWVHDWIRPFEDRPILGSHVFFLLSQEKRWWKIWRFEIIMLPLHRIWKQVLISLTKPRKFGWVAETSSLLNCRARLAYRGFESPSFRSLGLAKRYLKCSVHLTVRIQDSQSWHKSSILLPSTTKGRLFLPGGFI